MLADCLTKPLGSEKISQMNKLIGLISTTNVKGPIHSDEETRKTPEQTEIAEERKNMM